jgi:hypothetical protein
VFKILNSLKYIYCKTNNPHSPAKPAGGFYVRILWISIIFTVFASCNKDEVPEPVRIDRTIIVYMAADNDLWDVALVNSISKR